MNIEDDPGQISKTTQNDQIPAVNFNGPDLKPVGKQKLKDLMWEFRGLFASEGVLWAEQLHAFKKYS